MFRASRLEINLHRLQMCFHLDKSMAFSTTGLLNTHVIFVFRHGKHLCNKYFKYSYILAQKIICEDITKMTQIIVKIWTHLFL